LRERSGGDVESWIQTVESWRKMEAAAKNRAGCREEWSVGCVPPILIITIKILLNSMQQ